MSAFSAGVTSARKPGTSSAAHPTTDLTAYDLYLRASARVLASARQIPEALHLMEQAIGHDPRYGPALAWAALCCSRQFIDDRSEDREADARKGVDFARRPWKQPATILASWRMPLMHWPLSARTSAP